MSLNFATLVMHDGKSLVKVNPLRVNYLVSIDEGFTKIHFGLDQTIDVAGELEAVEQVLCSVRPS